MPDPAEHAKATPLSEDGTRRRRPRYPGTHPRRFEQRYKELRSDELQIIQAHVRAQGRTPAGTHVPVLVAEVLNALQVMPGLTVADCTIGYGGHAQAFLNAMAPSGRLIGMEIDAIELLRTRDRLRAKGYSVSTGDSRTIDTGSATTNAGSAPLTISVHRSHFAGLPKVLQREGRSSVDVVFADLGVSSMQIDDPSRGFGFKADGPLDMRMDNRAGKAAADIIAEWSWHELAAALRELADEPHADRIARAVAAHRNHQMITRTSQLVGLIFEATGTSKRNWRAQVADGLHPAARTFQALRMIVNEELSGLEQFLRVAPHCLAPGGRIGIISFHSGEDRRVKHAFRDGLRNGFFDAVSNEVIRPSASEIHSNPRSRSAKFRRARRAAG